MKTTTVEQPKKPTQRRLEGTVVSDKGAKTIVVTVERTLKHRLYGKQYTRTRRFHVHDEKEQYSVGDVVEFVECRPLSKLKHWRVVYKNEPKA